MLLGFINFLAYHEFTQIGPPVCLYLLYVFKVGLHEFTRITLSVANSISEICGKLVSISDFNFICIIMG